MLYETRFDEARSRFLNWEKENPRNPLGQAWEAASYLFEEFYQQGVLSSQLFWTTKDSPEERMASQMLYRVPPF